MNRGMSPQKLKEIAARGTLFEPNLLPDSINQTIIGLCDIVSQQQDEINDLKQNLSKARSDVSVSKTELFKIHLQMDDINFKEDIQKLYNRISTLEESQRKFRFTVTDTTRGIQDSLEKAVQKNHELEDDLRLQISHLTPEIVGYPKTYAYEDDQPIIIDHKLVDVSPLIRGLYRDSRRLDGVDQTISSIRIENENVVNAVAAAQDNLQQFNHNLHDLGLSLIKYKTLENERANYFQASTHSLEKQVAEIWAYLNNVNDNLHHTISNTMQAIEEFQSIMTRMSNRPLPTITSLGDVFIECTKNQEHMHEKKTVFEGEREHFVHYPEDKHIDPIIGNVNVGTIRNTSKYMNIEGKFDTLKQKFDETLIQVNMEDLRVQVNELMRGSSTIHSKFEELEKLTKQRIEGKVDSITMERLFAKYQSLLDKVSQKIEELEEVRPVSAKTSRIALNYNEPIRPKKKKPHIDELPMKQTQQIREIPKSTLSAKIYGTEQPNPNKAIKVCQRAATTVRLASANIQHKEYD